MQPAHAAPKTPDSLFDRGVVEMNRGNYLIAVSLLERALKVQPGSAHVLYTLAAAQVRAGVTESGLGNLERAIAAREFYRSRARQDPDFTPVKWNARFQELVGLGYEYDLY